MRDISWLLPLLKDLDKKVFDQIFSFQHGMGWVILTIISLNFADVITAVMSSLGV